MKNLILIMGLVISGQALACTDLSGNYKREDSDLTSEVQLIQTGCSSIKMHSHTVVKSGLMNFPAVDDTITVGTKKAIKGGTYIANWSGSSLVAQTSVDSMHGQIIIAEYHLRGKDLVVKISPKVVIDPAQITMQVFNRI